MGVKTLTCDECGQTVSPLSESIFAHHDGRRAIAPWGEYFGTPDSDDDTPYDEIVCLDSLTN